MHLGKTFAVLLFSIISLAAVAQDKVIRLYDGTAPGSESWKQTEQENRTNLWQTRVVFNVVNPEWRLDKVMIFCGICCGAAFLSSGGGDDLAFGTAWGGA